MSDRELAATADHLVAVAREMLTMEMGTPTQPARDPAARGETPEVSIVMPCLNEVRTVGQCIRRASQALQDHCISGEIIVADNGSTDGSQALAARLGARVVDVAERGYGAALAAGIAAARGQFVIMGDSDESYDFGILMPFLEKLRQGYDLVMGNRFRGGVLPGAMPAMHRYFGNPILSLVGQVFFKSPCGDFYCGQRAFRKAAIEGLRLKTTGMEYALEMLVKGTMMGLLIGEVPVTLSPDGRDRPPHLRRWRDGWRSLRFFLLYSPRWLFLYPSLCLMCVGALVGAWLMTGPRQIGGSRLDIHTLIYCAAAVIVGFQLFTFSVFGKLLAIATGLHPRNPRLQWLLRGGVLESGLILGMALFLAGLAISSYALLRWADTRFGDLDPFSTMRIVIPAVLSLTLGIQVISASFTLGLLQGLFDKGEVART
jgi:glycosyltransferase involved in cell wall biosynthesis